MLKLRFNSYLERFVSYWNLIITHISNQSESYPEILSDRSDTSDSWNAVTVQCDSRLHVKGVSDRSDTSDIQLIQP